MRFYTKQHRYYCGIDLHAKTDVHLYPRRRRAPSAFTAMGPPPRKHFLATIAAYREDLVVAVECIFTW